MQGLIEAAVQAASEAGVQAAIVLIGNGAEETYTGAQTPAHAPDEEANADDAAFVEHLQAELAKAKGEVANLRASIEGEAKLEGAEVSDQVAALNLELQRTRQARAGAEADLEAVRSELEAMQKAAPEGAGERPPQADGVALDTLGVDTLGLEGKLQRAITGAGLGTIGELRASYLAGELRDKVGTRKMTKDSLNAVGMALLGRVHSGKPDHQVALPLEGAAGAPNGAQDVPEGHTDRGWLARLNAARAKDGKLSQSSAELAALVERVKAAHPEVVKADGDIDTEKLAAFPLELSEYSMRKSTDAVIRAQLIAMLWACGLPHGPASDATKLGAAVDAALAEAGVQVPPAAPTA